MTTGYVGVSLPEEMSVREVLEFDRGIRDALGHGLDLIVVNGVQPDRFTDQRPAGSKTSRVDHVRPAPCARRCGATGAPADTPATCAGCEAVRRRR